jgi:hypothetical protein
MGKVGSFRKAVVPAIKPKGGMSLPPATREPVEAVELPSIKCGGVESLDKGATIIYGERGIGKSTLASAIFGGEALFEMFETDRDLKVYARDVRKWDTFLADVKLFLAGKTPVKYSGIVVDNGAMAYDCAMDYACKLHGFDHPGGMNDYGASWNKVKKEFIGPFRQLLTSRNGLVVVCHELEKEIETKEGRKYIRIRPDWSKQADDFLSSFVENIFYYYYAGSERWLQIVGDELITAKVKSTDHFFTPDGERIVRIPMGNSIEEAHENLQTAFNNEQEHSYATTGKEEKKGEGTELPSFKKRK